jgi:hypothetical protein
MQEPDDDVAAMAGRYARRAALAGLYGPLRPEVMQARHERLRVLAALLRRHARAPLGELRLLEVGCGQGGNLLDLIGLGFEPACWPTSCCPSAPPPPAPACPPPCACCRATPWPCRCPTPGST